MMDTIRGSTAIDTLYELKGFQLANAFAGAFFWLAVAVFVGFGLVSALYRAGDENRLRRLVVYLVQAIVVIHFLMPVRVNVALPSGFSLEAKDDLDGYLREGEPTIEAPRIMVWSHIAIDAVTRLLVGSVNATFAERPWHVERIAVLLRKARIQDPDLRRRYQAFVVSCALPAWSESARRGGALPGAFYDPFSVPDAAYQRLTPITADGLAGDGHLRPIADGKSATCKDARAALHAEVYEHVGRRGGFDDRTREVYGFEELIELVKQNLRNTSVSEAVSAVMRHVIYNETMGLLHSSEIATLQAAVPDYGMFHTSQQSSSHPQDLVDWARTIVSFFIKLGQSVDQWIDHHAEGPALYYKVVCYAPYVMGISSMILLAIFPFAGFAALLPGRWAVLLTWMKFILWVKLWVVLWAILARFNAWRVSLDDLGSDPSNGIGDQTYIFPAIAAMYLVAPALSLVVVHLLDATARSATGAVGSLVPGGAGGGGFSPGPAQQAAPQGGNRAPSGGGRGGAGNAEAADAAAAA